VAWLVGLGLAVLGGAGLSLRLALARVGSGCHSGLARLASSQVVGAARQEWSRSGLSHRLGGLSGDAAGLVARARCSLANDRLSTRPVGAWVGTRTASRLRLPGTGGHGLVAKAWRGTGWLDGSAWQRLTRNGGMRRDKGRRQAWCGKSVLGSSVSGDVTRQGTATRDQSVGGEPS